VSAQEVEEYNAFGPWIVEITEPRGVPKLYARYPLDFTETLRVLKFPRPEVRRDLREGMDLYDYVLILTSSRVTLLQRQGDTFVEGSFALSSLTSISSGADLLDGWLDMRFAGGESYSLPYNGSASATITRLVDTIRGLITSDADAPPASIESIALTMPLGSDDLGRADTVLAHKANELYTGEGSVSVLAAAGRRIVASGGSGLERLRHRVTPATLQGAVVATTATELVVFSRASWITRTAMPQLSLTRTLVPLALVDSVEISTHPHYPEVSVVAIRSAASLVEILLLDPEPLAKGLAAWVGAPV
jgi:hypothetical protein